MQITRFLTDDLLHPKYRRQRRPHDPKVKGHCYVACEAIYHLSGGRKSGLIVNVARTRGGTHWWLVSNTGKVIDPTGTQFRNPERIYRQGRRTSFLTAGPSRRARILMERICNAQSPSLSNSKPQKNEKTQSKRPRSILI